MTYSGIEEAARRRKLFISWLSKAWEWAVEEGRPEVADKVEDMLSHVDEPDYPLWEIAVTNRLVGDTKLAERLRKVIGIPIATPRATGWEKDINHSPVIALDSETWEKVYSMLGWANRFIDQGMTERNFYLWSPAANLVRFTIKEAVAAPVQEE